MAIDWFPGHMVTARKEAALAMRKTDVVIEVLDARVPRSAINPIFEQLRRENGRAALKVLNKSDLADPEQLSGVTQWRNLLVVCPDEGDEFNVLRSVGSRYEVVNRVGLLSDSNKEIDMEGAASDSEYVYIVGSHSIRRTRIDRTFSALPPG